tara:strand:- start:326 stop:502 length:177 start_codon:yes stop_codon:yes gene_type:complete
MMEKQIDFYSEYIWKNLSIRAETDDENDILDVQNSYLNIEEIEIDEIDSPKIIVSQVS